MARAAARPSFIARITVEPPRTTPPLAWTLGIDVSPQSWITILPRFFTSCGVDLCSVRSGACPMAAITVSAGVRNPQPGTGTGARRPLSLGSPGSIRVHSISRTDPFSSPDSATGAARNSNRTPSSPTCSISSWRAFRPARPRR